MKSIKKRILLIFLVMVLLFLFNNLTYAQEPIKIMFDIPCPEFLNLQCPTVGSSISNYIIRLYLFALGIVGIIAVGAIVIGGIEYAISGGNPDRKRDAKDRITSAIWGIVLLIGAAFILNTINPKITKLEITEKVIVPVSGISQFKGYSFGKIKACDITAIVFAAYGNQGCDPTLSDDDFKKCQEQKMKTIIEQNLGSKATNECYNKFPMGGNYFYEIKNPNKTPSCLSFYKLDNNHNLVLDKDGQPILNDFKSLGYKPC